MFDFILKIWNWFKWPICAIFAVIILYFILISIDLLVEMKRTGDKPKKRVGGGINPKVPILKKLFYQFPRMMALDILYKNPDAFPYRGIIIFEGEQGQGKTSSMMQYCRDMQLEYPQVKCITNLKYTYASESLKDWRQLLTYVNGELGVIAVIDELQNWFSSKDSKDFPPEMLSVVTQNRKNRRIILGTAQSFYMLAKDIRTQCTEVRSCRTLFNCLTIVVRKKPVCDSAGNVIKWKLLGYYWFVQTPELRESYDTYEVIKRFAHTGFTSKSERQNNTGESVNDLVRGFMNE